MLDNDPPTFEATDAAAESPAPRRRRSASRPAGPPAQRPLPAEAVDAGDESTGADAETAVTTPDLDVAPDEAEATQHAETAETVDAADDADEAGAVEQPVAHEEPDADEEPAADEPGAAAPPAADEPDAEEPAPDEPAADEPDVVHPGAEEEAGEPVADEGLIAAEQEPVTAQEPLVDESAEQPPADGAAEQQTTDAPRSRRRARAPITEVSVDEPPSEPEAEPLSLDELPTLDELAPRPAGQRGNGRRRASEPIVATDDAAEADPVAESLVQLSRSRGRRRTRKSEGDAAAALDELAAAIGGQLVEATGDGDAAEPSVAPEDAEVALDEGTILDDPEESEGDVDDQGAADDDDSDEGPRRRRRRRGGRRRRRGGTVETTDDDGEDATDEDEPEADGEPEASETDGEADTAGADSTTSSRRRRRRRRRGEDTTGSDDDPTDVVVRVRQPRRAKSSDEVTGIDGSTRMEAKRQRRREGRAAGRRRAPILSEAEFLARRESVDRRMLIRQADDYTQIAVLEDGVLIEHYVDRASATSMIGNVYLGKVQNVLPSMEAAFIDIGRGRNAVLYAGEVDWDAFGVTGGDRKMEKVFKSGQSVLVQVSKDPVGAKGARLTAHVSIPGRYVVYSPGGQLSGISRKLPEGERSRLKGILDELVGDTASVIVRTAAEGASEDELVRDVNRLKAQWEVIEKKVKAGKSPTQLYAEPDLTVRIVRDLFTEDFGRLVVDGNGKGEDAWDTVDAYVSHVAPHLKERLEHWNRAEAGDLFQANRIDEQIAKALERKVFLPSGGSLIIDRTEAMTVIDVNTGKFTGTSGNLEATVTSNNLEAAEEIVRQLRLRDIGGIIVIDFIDMVLPANRELLLRRLVECLGRDRTRHQVAEVTSLGLVQMTRKRIGTGLAEAFTVTCETCHGRGYHRHDTPVDSQAPADGGEREHGRRRRH